MGGMESLIHCTFVFEMYNEYKQQYVRFISGENFCRALLISHIFPHIAWQCGGGGGGEVRY